AIRRLSAELVELPQPEALAERFTATLRDGIGVQGVALYTPAPEACAYEFRCAAGSIRTPTIVRAENLPTPQRKQTIVMMPAPNASGEAGSTPWEAYLPVVARGKCLALIALAPKRSGAAIDDSDVTLLGLVAAQLAIALQNAEYVDQIKQQKAEI